MDSVIVGSKDVEMKKDELEEQGYKIVKVELKSKIKKSGKEVNPKKEIFYEDTDDS